MAKVANTYQNITHQIAPEADKSHRFKAEMNVQTSNTAPLLTNE